MMRLYFVRHGESEANHLRVISNRGRQHGLTGLGRQQAAALAQALELEPIGRIYASPLLRAAETAEILSQAWGGVPILETEALREYDCGVLEGRSDAATWATYDRVVQDWVRGDYDSCPPEGESFRDIQARFVPFVESLLRPLDGAFEPDPGDLVLVGHGGLFAVMLPLVLANVDSAFAQSHPIEHTSPIVAEHRADHLVCLRWCGLPVPGNGATG